MIDQRVSYDTLRILNSRSRGVRFDEEVQPGAVDCSEQRAKRGMRDLPQNGVSARKPRKSDENKRMDRRGMPELSRPASKTTKKVRNERMRLDEETRIAQAPC